MSLIKSKNRVRDFGEVFTPQNIVKAMLDLIPLEIYEREDSRFLEPACGSGNFLVEILKRKLDIVKKKYKRVQEEYEFKAILAIGSIYGIELLEDNVQVARGLLYSVIENEYKKLYRRKIKKDFLESVKYIINRNILQGDALTLKDKDGEYIVFSEWSSPKPGKIKRKDFIFKDVFENDRELALENPNAVLPFKKRSINDKGESFFEVKPIVVYKLTHYLNIYKAYD